jgi:hypothetical protein
VSDTAEPKRVYLGTIDSGPNAIILPHRAVNRADAAFDAERVKREKETALAKLAIMQNVRGRVRLKKALRLIFGRRGR